MKLLCLEECRPVYSGVEYHFEDGFGEVYEVEEAFGKQLLQTLPKKFREVKPPEEGQPPSPEWTKPTTPPHSHGTAERG